MIRSTQRWVSKLQIPRKCFTEMATFDLFPQQRVHCCAAPSRFPSSTRSLVSLALLSYMTHTWEAGFSRGLYSGLHDSPEIIASEAASGTERNTDEVSEVNTASLLVSLPSLLLYSGELPFYRPRRSRNVYLYPVI